MDIRLKTLSPAYRARQLALAASTLDLGAALRAVPIDLAIVVGVMVLAAVPRLVLLTEIPSGFHGDEAWTGIDARRVLDEGWIGPYVKSALGQPAGPLYFAAPIVGIFGDTVFSVRLAMAMLGIITIPVAYLTFRVMFDRTVGVFAAVLLAIGLWHLHYSRLGFMVISWPLMELLTLLFLFLGLKTKRWLFFALSGLAFGAGLYTYNAYPVFALPVALLAAWLIGRQLLAWRTQGKPGGQVARFVAQIGLMGVMAFVVALPMIRYATDADNDFLSHHRGVSLLETEEWKSAGLIDRVDILSDATGSFLSAAFWDGQPDGADGAGYQAMVSRVTLALLVLGIPMVLWRWRQPAAVAVTLMLIILPFATIITTNGMFRQSLGVVPFLAVLAALPLAFWWDRALSLEGAWRGVSYAGIGAVIVAIGFLNFSFYFGEYRDTITARSTFGEEFVAASEYMRGLPGEPFVYFYSGRWAFNYETRQFLASDVPGEDRSEEFGTFSLEPNRQGAVAYVFLNPYLEQADEVARLYSGGALTESVGNDGAVLFRAYYLPSTEGLVEVPTDREPEATPTILPGADERDATRAKDLAAIRAALEQYRREHGGYPDTGGQVQSLCSFAEIDAGCELSDVLDPLPQDPLGNPAVHGYWYAATAAEFRLYAQRETDALPGCPKPPEHLSNIDSLSCVSGP